MPQRMQRAHGICRFLARSGSEMQIDGGKLAGDGKDTDANMPQAATANFSSSPAGTSAALVLKDEVRAADDDLFALDGAGDAVRDDVLHAASGIPRGSVRARCAASTTAFAIECG